MASAVPVVISDKDVKQILTWDAIVPIIENMLCAVSIGEATQPPRTIMPVTGKNGVLLTMPGYSSADDALACKVVTAFPDNKKKGLQTIFGTVLLLDSDTGKIIAIMDGNEITAQRTAAASVVATQYLCNESNILAVLGSGTQARCHIKALEHHFHFKEIRVWNHQMAGAIKLLKEFPAFNNIRVCEKAEDCVKNADVIVTATYAAAPILKRCWVKPGVHINAIGAGVNHHSELDEALYKEATICTDTMEGAKIELKGLGDIGVTILGEIGEIILGKKIVPRENITVFHSLGMAIEDVVTAKYVYERYKRLQQTCRHR